MCTVTNYVYYVLLDVFLTEFIMNKSKKISSKGHEKNGLFILIGMKKSVAFYAFIKCILKLVQFTCYTNSFIHIIVSYHQMPIIASIRCLILVHSIHPYI